MRRFFLFASVISIVGVLLIGTFWRPILWALIPIVPLVLLGCRDIVQRRHGVLRNYPLVGHFRYLLESIRPEISQYFIESNTDGTPFSREGRSLVYQRAKRELDTVAFGTQRDVYEVGYEWIQHSISARHPAAEAPRVTIGSGRCAQPYATSLLSISAMSYGSLSKNAILALNEGAKRGGFVHNTGEGGVSPYHLQPGGDLCWQIGTGYFGCRRADGGFDAERFARRAKETPSIKMIEIKLSQGAKPGHGGILPAAKVTPEIAEIRGVPLGRDVLSPPGHSAFSTPRELCLFIARLRELSGGKPVGIKLCLGRPVEFLSLIKALLDTRELPDFVVVDGGEGGTGAAPLEFSNSVGTPLREGLVFVHSALTGAGLRPEIKLGASGKILHGFDMARSLALGADFCVSARGMMFAIGCIQARRCNSNACPVGVATQDPGLAYGLDVEDKARRVVNYHHETVDSLLELLGAAGVDRPEALTPSHILRRVDSLSVQSYEQIYDFLEPGVLLEGTIPRWVRPAWEAADADCFQGRASAARRPATRTS